LDIFKDLKHLSQSWKERFDTHVLWLAYQAFEVDVATSTWLDIVPSLDHWGLVNDVWIMSIMAFVFIEDLKVSNPLHLLSIPEFRMVRSKGKEIVWGYGDGYCDVRNDLSDCECDEF
jgi:hypothetical protein